MPYEIINDPEKIKIDVQSVSLEDFFTDAFLGSMEVINGSIPDVEEDDVVRVVKIKSADLAELLLDFLNEILFLSEDNKEVYAAVEFKNLEDDALEAVLTGAKTDGFAENVSGVSYFSEDEEAGIQDENGDWHAILAFD